MLKNLKFYGFHGIHEEESIKGQAFYVDVEMMLDLKKAGQSDNLDNTVDYSNSYEIVKDIVENNKFNLIECVAEKIAQKILSTSPLIKKILIRVKKPFAPIEGEFENIEVEIMRARDEK